MTFEPVTIEAHRAYVFAAVLFVFAQAALIAALLASRARRRQSEARNNAILRAIPDIVFVQSRDGVYLDYSAKDRSVLLVPPSRFLGKNMREILPPALAETFASSINRLFEGQEPMIVEYDVPIPSGELRHYEARLVRCESDKFLAIVRDITERRRSEAVIRDEQLRLRLATAAGGVGVWDWNLETNECFADEELKAQLGYDDDEMRQRVDGWRRIIQGDGLTESVDVRALTTSPASKEF
ncbi:MAG TPA: PAS domain-containing protein, partial [Gemmatimonadaceae bacterium]